MSVERFLRKLHGWLGALILPWVVIAGLTGLYMNHPSLVLQAFPKGHFSYDAVAQNPVSALAAAKAVVARYPGEVFEQRSDTRQQGRDFYRFESGDVTALVDMQSGYFQAKTRYQTRYFTPEGRSAGRKISWSLVLTRLHRDGWIGGALGTWPADSVAAALILFGLSGIYLFAAPRLRRAKNIRAKNIRAKNDSARLRA